MYLSLLFGTLLSSAPVFAQSAPTLSSSSAETSTDVYVIQSGDTLWDISYKFLGNPYVWPSLWSINDYITNPHWIYPGNRIYFTPGTLLESPGLTMDAPEPGYTPPRTSYTLADVECGPDVRFTNAYPISTYTGPGFLAQKDEVEELGHVYAAKTGRAALGEGDLVYLEMEDINDVECGDVFSLYRRSARKVRHPDKRRQKFGFMHAIVAEVRVLHIEGEIATAVIRQSYQQAERGDKVGPLIPVTTQARVEAPRGDLEGVIVAQLNEKITQLGPNETLFLDIGRSDGVEEGNTFYVVHRRDELIALDHYDEEIPSQVIARILVTRVDEDSSTAVLVDAMNAVKVGDNVAMKID